MIEKVKAIANLFGDETKTTKYCEDLKGMECKVTLTLKKCPEGKAVLGVLPEISQRDVWRLRILTAADDDLLDLKAGQDVGDVCKEDNLQPYYDDEVTLEYTLTKTKGNNTITVYDYEQFVKYVSELNVVQCLNVIRKQIDECLWIEVWGEKYEAFHTRSIGIYKKGADKPVLPGNENRKSRKELCEEYCQWGNSITDVTPDDCHIEEREDDGKLTMIFDQLSQMLSACFVSDYSQLNKDGATIRLSGYRMHKTEMRAQKVEELKYDARAEEQWYRIYDWCYTGGSTSDRLVIARNIITLNLHDINTLSLNDSTLGAIRSNFKIFERKNVHEYVKVRKDVSQSLLDLQGKVNSIVEGFSSDFQKSVISLGTFFLTVIVVRVVARGDIAGAFTGNLVALSFVMIMFSAVNLVYYRCTVDKKEKLFYKHYGQLRKRYEKLLSKEELNELFADSDPNKCGSEAYYIEWQKRKYTQIWIAALVVFILLLLTLWCYNTVENTNAVKILKQITLCCTKNI